MYDLRCIWGPHRSSLDAIEGMWNRGRLQLCVRQSTWGQRSRLTRIILLTSGATAVAHTQRRRTRYYVLANENIYSHSGALVQMLSRLADITTPAALAFLPAVAAPSAHGGAAILAVGWGAPAAGHAW